MHKTQVMYNNTGLFGSFILQLAFWKELKGPILFWKPISEFYLTNTWEKSVKKTQKQNKTVIDILLCTALVKQSLTSKMTAMIHSFAGRHKNGNEQKCC